MLYMLCFEIERLKMNITTQYGEITSQDNQNLKITFKIIKSKAKLFWDKVNSPKKLEAEASPFMAE